MTPPLIIAGFHRSGTSLLAHLMHEAGLFLGSDLIGAMPSNPYGHFEDREIVRLHDAILSDNDQTWQVTEPLLPHVSPHRWEALKNLLENRKTNHPFWGFKDPRVCLMLGVWRYLDSDLRVVMVYRHPVDSVYSLERRHAGEILADNPPQDVHRKFFEVPDLGLSMWIAHNESLIQYAEKYSDSTIILPFSLLMRGHPIVDEVRSRWNLPLSRTATASVIDISATTRRPNRQIIYDSTLVARAMETWSRLESLALRG